MVSSICFGVVFFGKYFFSLLVLIFKVSFWFPFFLRHNRKYRIHVKPPALA